MQRNDEVPTNDKEGHVSSEEVEATHGIRGNMYNICNICKLDLSDLTATMRIAHLNDCADQVFLIIICFNH